MDLFERVAQLHGVSPEEVREEIRSAVQIGSGLDVEPEAFVHFLAQACLQLNDQDVSADD